MHTHPHTKPWLLLASGALAVLTTLGSSGVSAQQGPTDVRTLIAEVADHNQRMAKSQQIVGSASDESARLTAEYKAIQKRNEALGVYNKQLEELLASQAREQAQIAGQVERVTEVSRQVTPLMLRMLDALAKFVELDAPFLSRERRGRVADLRTMMGRADVTESEKFRRILEAYQIENDYGRTLEAYRDTLSLGGSERTVEVLRVGRVAIVAKTLDDAIAVYWNRESEAWRPLPDVARRDLAKAFRIARKQGAPDLVRIPVVLPKEPS